MEEEAPSQVYAVESKANEEMEFEMLETFVITEGMAESSGYHSSHRSPISSSSQ